MSSSPPSVVFVAIDETAHRLVEAQHRVATLALVDSLEEQALLEEMIDTVKPRTAEDAAFEGLHFLLRTPFRYPPLRHGSRFGTRAERGIWYGSSSPEVAMAEVAYYRFLFRAGTTAELPSLWVEATQFSVPLKTSKGADLTEGFGGVSAKALSDPRDWTRSQAVGATLREAGVQAFRYRSARDAQGGVNLGVFTPRAFRQKSPHRATRTWRVLVEATRVTFLGTDPFRPVHHVFDRAQFLVNGELPAPGFAP